MAAPIFEELKRRRVIRALIGYGIASFAVLQVVEPVMHGLRWPDEFLSYVVVGLAAGFPIVVSLAWIFDVKAGRIERTEPAAARRAWLPLLLVGVGVLAAAPGLVYWFALRARPAAKGTPEKIAQDRAPSIAVLPLVNLSRDPDQEYFADGLAEELLDLLAKVPGLRVAARTSAFSFKGKTEDVRTIGEKLNVKTLLEGSVRKSGSQVRITTQLINAADGFHLWSETYDRQLTDVFVVQDEIARAVVAALKMRLVPGQTPTAREHRTANTDAYNQYLLGRQFFSRATVDGYHRAAQAYEKAIALDPNFALAWAGLAHATYWIADSADDAASIIEGQKRAAAAADKAVALDPALPEAYGARGAIRSAVNFDWQGAAADFKRALAINPENAVLLLENTVHVLRVLGRTTEGIASVKKALELDPLNNRAWSILASLLVSSGQLEEGRKAASRSLEINPEQAFASAWIGLSFMLENRPAEAFAAFERSSAPWFRLAGRILAQDALGKKAEARADLDRLIKEYGHNAAYQIADIYAWLGERDQAFEWLERARAQHDGGLTLLKTDAHLRGLHSDARWVAFLRKMNLPVE